MTYKTVPVRTYLYILAAPYSILLVTSRAS